MTVNNAKASRTKKYLTSYLFVAPFMILFAIFTITPVVMAMILSFTHYTMLQPATFSGFTNYLRMILDDDVFAIAVKNTFLIAFITGPIGYIISLFVAWLINDLKPLLRSFLTLLFYAPSISGAVYVIWLVIFGSDQYGYLNSFLMRLGFSNDPIQWLRDPRYMLTVIIIVQLWLSLGTSFLAFIAGLQGIDRNLYEAGAVDGIRNRWQELWFITLPSMRPQLMFGAVIQITASFAVGDICNNLAGFPSVDYAAETWVTHAMDYSINRLELGYASALATVLFLVMVGANKLVQRFLRHVGE